jgi:hypothetical protein
MMATGTACAFSPLTKDLRPALYVRGKREHGVCRRAAGDAAREPDTAGWAERHRVQHRVTFDTRNASVGSGVSAGSSWSSALIPVSAAAKRRDRAELPMRMCSLGGTPFVRRGVVLRGLAPSLRRVCPAEQFLNRFY